tara:strand:+ start:146 stop:1138 length:993 start_codon:yes stop_codon:yes gene_type:complete
LKKDIILITGCAGFIGSQLAKRLTLENFKVIGVDLYSITKNSNIQSDRIINLKNCLHKEKKENFFTYKKLDILNKKELKKIFDNYNITKVVHLAASTGVRESSISSEKYYNNNISGFINVIEKCKDYKIRKFIYASSSSIYNDDISKKLTAENEKTDQPINIYAFTKKSNELLAYTYSHLYNLTSIGLRFFSVYGPFGRPDMAYFKFTKSILKSENILLNNKGENIRDFTYIDDVVTAIIKILVDVKKNKSRSAVYNVGCGKPVKIIDLIKLIEKITMRKSKITYSKNHIEDAIKTGSNNTKLINDYNINFNTEINAGMQKFISWFKKYN